MAKTKKKAKRREYQAPAATGSLGWRFHHLGIPTRTSHTGERYLPQYKMYVSGFESSPYGVEWMRFEPDSPVSEIIRKVPHLAFEVDDLEAAIKGKQLIGEVVSPAKGIRVAMFLDDGAVIEVLQFDKPISKECF